MFDNIVKFFKKFSKEENKDSKDTAKERLHLVLMQDRANVSADFMELMKQEIIEVIKKYIDVDENSIDVKLTNKVNDDGTTGAPMLYANIPIVNIKDETRQINIDKKEEKHKEEKKEEVVEKEETTDEVVEEKEIDVSEEEKKEEVKEDQKEVQENNEDKSDETENEEEIVETENQEQIEVK